MDQKSDKGAFLNLNRYESNSANTTFKTKKPNLTISFEESIMRNFLKLASLAILSLVSISAFSAETAVDKAAVTTKEAVYTVIDKSDYKVSFKNGSAVVDQSSKNSLKGLFRSLKGELIGAEIVIGAWSDKDFPLDPNTSLTANDAALAKARAESVERAIKKLGIQTKIQIINFGEQNTLLSNLFRLGSDAPEVKDAVQSGATDSRKIAAVSQHMKDKGGASKAVVLVRRESDNNNM
jgi:hypothetical protein